MLDFVPLVPAYPPHYQDNDSPFRPQPMQADPLPYNPYSLHTAPLAKVALDSTLTPSPAFALNFNPGPQSFTFDPFADEDSSTSSVASERERELEVQRLHRIEFLRRREWMRRVVAWVDGISHGTVSVSRSSSRLRTSMTNPNKRQIPLTCVIHRLPHYHRHLHHPSSNLLLDLSIIPHRATQQMHPHFTTVLVRPLPPVPMRTMNPTLSTALPSQVLLNRLQSLHLRPRPHLHLHHPQCL